MKIENHVERFPAHHPVQRYLTSVLLALVIMGALVWGAEQLKVRDLIGQWKLFEVKRITVDAPWPLKEDDVKRWLPDIVGSSMLTLRVAPLVERLKSKPWVAEVVISKNYPSELAVSVKTRTPRAVVVQGQSPHYVDGEGRIIDRVSPEVSAKFSLPVLSLTRQSTLVKWELADGMKLLEQLEDSLPKRFGMAELVLETYPYFRVYLTEPRVEVLFDHGNWSKQISRLKTLLDNPPSQIRQMARINLVFPKKAIVSSSLSN